MLTKLENYKPVNPIQWNKYLSPIIGGSIKQIVQDHIIFDRFLNLFIWQHIVWRIQFDLMNSLSQKYGDLNAKRTII